MCGIVIDMNDSTKQQLFILGMPHNQLTREHNLCAYQSKARKLADMMTSLGYKVYVLASEENESAGELITCITKDKQHEFFGDNDHHKTFYNITWNPSDPHWQHFNTNAIEEIKKRIKPQDLILSFAGNCQKQVGDAFPNHQFVEAGIGYTGVAGKYLVYESYAWQNFVGGLRNQDNGEFYETVINNYWDISEFPESDPQDYYLYIGRLIDRKGYRIAQDVCEKLGKRLILAGQIDHEFQGYGEYIGTVNTEERGRLMAGAIAGFVPTLYRPPLEGVHCELQLCGTPVITTNFGVFTETVENDVNGQRCNDFQEFLNAAQWAEKVGLRHRQAIRESAQSKWSMDVIKHQYDEYFQRLQRLYTKEGWYLEY